MGPFGVGIGRGSWVAFLLFGVAVAGSLTEAEREPAPPGAAVILFCCLGAFALRFVTVPGEWLLEALVWWSIIVANLLASDPMLRFFYPRHRVVCRRLLYEEP